MKEITGDILTAVEDEAEVIVCQFLDCRGRMNSGLPLRVRRTFPDVFSACQKVCRKAGSADALQGRYQISETNCGYFVASVFCRDFSGGISYGHLDMALRHLAWQFPDGIFRIPWGLGCDVRGEDWGYVKRIIEDGMPGAEIWHIPKRPIINQQEGVGKGWDI